MSAWEVTGAMERAGFRIDTIERKCPSGIVGRIFGHNWLTVRQLEFVPDGGLNHARVYLTQRCKRCHMENGRYNRVYQPAWARSGKRGSN